MYITNFAIEEFAKKPSLPYIDLSEHTNFLNTFMQNREDKATVTSLIVKSLRNADSLKFSSQYHVLWAMEFFGYSFSLSMEYEETICTAFEIYKKWLLTSDRPKCFDDNESHYQQLMIGHISLLFTEREGNLQHSKLCTKALILLNTVTDGLNLSKSTWNCILKILLISSHAVLTTPGSLSESVSPLLLTVLFEIWVKSGTRDTNLLQELCQKSSEWLDHIWFIRQWGAVVIELSKKVVSLLYGSFSPITQIVFAGLENNSYLGIEVCNTFTIELSAEYTIFLWHKFLSLMIENTKTKIPFDFSVHKELATTISKVIDVFLEVCDSRNTKIFAAKDIGPFVSLEELTASANLANQDYFARKSRIPMPSANSLLAIFGDWLFFHAITQDNFSEFGNAVAIGALCRVICKAQGPVSQTYLDKFFKTISDCFRDESNPLIVTFIISNSPNLFSLNHRGAKIIAFDLKFLKSIEALLSDPTNIAVKRPCCIILSTIVGLDLTSLNTDSASLIQKIFMHLLKSKNDYDVFKRIIWSLAVLASNINNVDEIVKTLIDQLQEIDYINQKVSYNSLLTCISTLPYIINKTSIAENVLKTLCSLIVKIQSKNQVESLTLHLFCILNWCIRFPKLFFSSELHQTVIETLKIEFNNKTVTECAEYVLGYLQNSLISNFEHKGSHLSAGIILNESNIKPCKSFLYKSEFIISIYDLEAKNSILLMLRNSIGKHVWSIELDFNSDNEKYPDLDLEICNIQQRQGTNEEESVVLPEDDRYDKFIQLFEKQSKVLENFKDVGCHNKKNNEKQESEKSVPYRKVLSQFGLLHESQLKDLIVLDSANQDLIKTLDNVLQKNQIVVPVLYLQDSESTLEEDCEEFSDNFQTFLNNLGIFVDSSLKSLSIFTNVQEFVDKYQSIIYASDPLNEIVFISRVFSKSFSLIDILSQGNIVLIWNEHIHDNYSLKNPVILEHPKLKQKTIIELIPAGGSNIKVKRYRNDCDGPLLDEMVVSGRLFPTLLVRTILNASPMFNFRIKSKNKRKEILKKIAETYQLSENEQKQKVLTQSFEN